MAEGTGTPQTGKQYSRRIRTPKKFFDFEVEDSNKDKAKEKKERAGKKSSDDKPGNNSTSARKKKKKPETTVENNKKDQSANDKQGGSLAGLERVVTKEPHLPESSDILDQTDEIKTDIKETKVRSKKRTSKPRNSLRSLNEARTNDIVGEEMEERIIANACEVDKVNEMVKSLRNNPKQRKKYEILNSDKGAERIPDVEKAVTSETTQLLTLVDKINTRIADTKGIEEENEDLDKDKTTTNDFKTIQKDSVSLTGKKRDNDVEVIKKTSTPLGGKNGSNSVKTIQKESTPIAGKKRSRRKRSCDSLNESVSESNRQNTPATPVPVEKEITCNKDSGNTTEDHPGAAQDKANESNEKLANKTPSSGRKRGKKRKGNDSFNECSSSEKNESSVVESWDMNQSEVVSRSGRKRRVINFSTINSKQSGDEGAAVKTKTATKSSPKNAQKEESEVNQGAGKTPLKTPQTKPKEKEHRCLKCEYVCVHGCHMKIHAAHAHQLHWTEENPEGSTDKAAMTQVIKIRKFLNCPKCNKRLNFVQYYHHHVEWCGREDETYMCEMCGNPNLKAIWRNTHNQQCSKVKEEIARAKHKAERLKEVEEEDKDISGKKRGAAKRALTMLQGLATEAAGVIVGEDSDVDPDAEIEEREETDEDEFNNDDDDDDKEEEDDRLGNSRPFEDRYSTFKRVKQKVTYHKYWETYTAMKKFAAKNHSEELYDTWLPRKQSWTALPPSECERYAPRSSKTSVQFTFDSPDTSVTLGLYQSHTSSAHSIFYTGLSVWKIAWCTVPLNHKGNQYLAVIGKKDQQDPFSTSKHTAEPSSVQIWDTDISSNTMHKDLKPRLCYTIAHDLGKATALQWCPSGCYNSPINKDLNPDCLLRLGLLALSFMDGTVRIFSLPHPDVSSETEAPPTYKPVPVACLVPKRAWQNGCAGCSCFDWSLAKGHTRVVAGYTDGTIALFCLFQTPSRLILQTSPTITLLPYHRFYPLGNLVRSVRFCAPSERRIVAGSEDFDTYFIDLDSTSLPVMADQPTSMTVNLASSLWHHGIFQACDDNYAVEWNKTRYIESLSLVYYTVHSVHGGERKDELLVYNTASQNGCIWDVTVSNWLNYVIACDNKGNLNGLPLQDMVLSQPDQKAYKFRQVIHTTSVQKINEGEKDSSSETSGASEKESCKIKSENSSAKISAEISQETVESNVNSKSCSLPEHVPNSSVNGVKSTENLSEHGASVENRTEGENSVVDIQSMPSSEVGVSFCDNDSTKCSKEDRFLLKYNDFFKGEKQGDVTDKERDTYSRYPVAALTTVALNPNHRQCLWVAFGGQPGLIRLVNVYNLLPRRMQVLLRQGEPKRSTDTSQNTVTSINV